jgi:hypothetical protein
MIDEKAQFEKRHVFYGDILGFSKYSLSEFFEPSRCFRLFGQLDRMVEEAKTEIDPSSPDPRSGHPPDYIVKPEVIYCSDAIAISTPATNVDAIWLCQAAAQIQNDICCHGFLVRGSIVTGDVYHSGNTLFGPAIVKAVELERKGGPPVIIVTDETLKYFRHAISDEDKEIIRIREHQLIVTEESPHPYIDPFWLTKIHTDQESISQQTRMNIECWRTLVEWGLKDKEERVREKYLWVANRFNQSLCDKPSGIKCIPVGGPK